jgi:nicotinate phosphoribosyltransferase
MDGPPAAGAAPDGAPAGAGPGGGGGGGAPLAPGRAALDAAIAARTDAYFNRTRAIVRRFGDRRVTYAVFLRRPVVSAPRLMVDWVEAVAAARATRFDVELMHPEGTWVGAGDPILYLSGSFAELADLETLYLQKLGPPCVAAHNAYQMCLELPQAAFLAMDARHCAGAEMQDMMAYAASVGGAAARREGAKGFVGNATDETAHWFGAPRGRGTMPHALIGYAESTVRAAEMFHEAFPEEDLTVLTDYFGREVTDGLAVCRRFPELAAAGRMAVRLDTHGGRFLEGLDPAESYAVLERHVPGAIRRYRSETELRHLVGTGVSAAAIWRMREALDEAGFPRVRIVASSGFNVAKCRVMAEAKAPIDVVGTGSFLPEAWSETYATADIVAYDGAPRVKVGREFLLRRDGERRRRANGGGEAG